MNKYIRTKDTIYEVLEDYKNSWLVRAKRNTKKNLSQRQAKLFICKAS